MDRLRDTKVGVCVKVITSNDERQLDILFTGDPQSGYTCFHALAECKHVKQMKAKFPEMHDVIIEFKISVRKARDLLSPQINRGVRLPSYFLELLIIKDFKENGLIGQQPYTAVKRACTSSSVQSRLVCQSRAPTFRANRVVCGIR